MCGYLGNMHDHPLVQPLLDELGISLSPPKGQFYQRKVCNGLVTQKPEGPAFTQAIWWYALKREGDRMIMNPDITSFNARNLDGRMWQRAINERRGLVFVSEVGESLKGNRHLMRARGPLAVGAVYKDWSAPDGSTVRSMAVITRPPHPRFSQYHDKSIPCFLPTDSATLNAWLDPDTPASAPVVADILNHPRIYTDLDVLPVKTFKRAESLGEPELLEADSL